MTTTLVDRPDTLGEMIGQTDLVNRLRIIVQGSQERGVQPPHVLLYGPAGHGKTTLGRIMAHELRGELEVTSGPMLKKSGDLAGILASAHDGDVLFIDEIHRMPSAVEETLYEFMEDGTLSIIAGSGAAARTVTMEMPKVTVVGATTLPGALSEPLRQRFGFHGVVAPYTVEELSRIVLRAWTAADVNATSDAATVVAERSKGVPRVALHLATRVLDYATVVGMDRYITEDVAELALATFGIDEGGWDETDRRILSALVANRRAMGLAQLAQMVELDEKTIEREHEGPLVRAGLVVRTPSGRLATPEAYEVVRGWQ